MIRRNKHETLLLLAQDAHLEEEKMMRFLLHSWTSAPPISLQDCFLDLGIYDFFPFALGRATTLFFFRIHERNASSTKVTILFTASHLVLPVSVLGQAYVQELA